MIIYNKVLITAIIGWAAAQVIKVLLFTMKYKKFDTGRIFGSGGMPSSHSSFVMSLTFKTGQMYGYNSAIFAIAMGMSLVVMYDAAGVRRAAGNQARILNLIIDDLNNKKGIQIKRLKELIGHTPVEVIAGAILGIIIGIVV